jgi:hypothetical protein
MSRSFCETRDSTVRLSGDVLIHPTLSRTLKPKEPIMTIEIRDPSLEARIQKQLQATGSASVEEVLLCLLDTQEEQDRWAMELQLASEHKPR